MNEIGKVRFSREEVRKNFIKSWLLIILLAAIAFGLSVWIGTELDDPRIGVLIGTVIALIVIPVQIFTAKWAILAMARGRKVNMDDPKERRAMQLLEGIAVSAGLSRTPDLYIMPSNIPNAFASGLSEKDAFVALTQGLLDMMTEQELEGVIGHEVGHIIHRDIMLNQLVVGLISLILVLATVLHHIVYVKALVGNRNSRNSNAGAAILVLMLVAILIRPLAMLISHLLQMAVSRKREYAADAVSVQLCSYGEGLASALEKLDNGGRAYTAKEKDDLGGSKLACMYINFPGGEWFSTHPPIPERVKRIRNMY